jgi:hypothetical protein
VETPGIAELSAFCRHIFMRNRAWSFGRQAELMHPTSGLIHLGGGQIADSALAISVCACSRVLSRSAGSARWWSGP